MVDSHSIAAKAAPDLASGSFFRCAHLRCEYATNPLATGTARLRLSWEVAANERDVFQAAFQILAATRVDLLRPGSADLWDSGRMESVETLVRYAGREPGQDDTVFWTVRAWSKSDAVTPWTEPATWETGPLVGGDWSGARWIAADYTQVARPFPSPTFHKAVALPKAIRRARAYFCGLGYGELFINGKKIERQVLDPGQTDYEKEALYNSFDITSNLAVGENIFSVLLGDGWFNQDRVWGGLSYGEPGFILKIAIEFADGSKEILVSDGSWTVTLEGPVRASNIYAGEIYDARREISAITELATRWSPTKIVPPLSPLLRPQVMPAIERTQELASVSRHSTQPGVWVYDFGQNFAGWCRLKVTAPRGTEICLRFAEVLDPEGNIDPLSTGVVHTRVVQTDRYFCRGGGEETWEPRFTYHGFRYVEVTGHPGEPPNNLLTGVVVHTALAPGGSFECSDALLNRLHETALWTERSNLHSVPTDCPARERCGWLGDAHVTAELLLYNFDSVLFLEKFHRDILHSLGVGGNPCAPTNIVPGKRHCGEANPDWAMATILIPWYLYLYAGDRDVFVDSYERLRGLLANFEAKAKEGILDAGFGDWCPPGRVEPNETPVALTSTALFYFVTRCVERFARELAQDADVAAWQKLGTQIREAFIQKFYDQNKGTFGSQTANALALSFMLYAPPEKERLKASLRQEITTRHQGHFNVGLHGMRYLFEVLSRHGLEDLCWEVIQAEGYPGFRHLFSLGATTYWETFFDPTRDFMLMERSRNHPMLGSFDAWLYGTIGGIQPDADHPGFRRIIMKPHFLRHLSYAKVTYRSVRGLISSEWSVRDGTFRWQVELPANTEAKIHIPASSLASVTESGKPLAEVSGLGNAALVGGYCVCQIGNGRFDFAAREGS